MPRTAPVQPPLLHGGDLRQRGWTAALTARFAPPPDGTRQTRFGTTVKLWLPETIEAVEATYPFRVAFRTASRRRVAARKAVETKLAKLDAWIDSLEIELPDMSHDEAVAYAIRDFNNHGLDRLCAGRIDHFREATPESDPRFLERISVNWLRHQATSYEEHLADTFGKVGADRAYDRIKAKVLDAIAAKWPGLAAECGRQRAQLGAE